jgi:hypothetical protein
MMTARVLLLDSRPALNRNPQPGHRKRARTSYLLMADETDAGYEDEPEQPAEPQSVS